MFAQKSKQQQNSHLCLKFHRNPKPIIESDLRKNWKILTNRWQAFCSGTFQSPSLEWNSMRLRSKRSWRDWVSTTQRQPSAQKFREVCAVMRIEVSEVFCVPRAVCAPEKVWNWFYAFSQTFSGDILFLKSRCVSKLNSFAVIKSLNILFRENNWFLVINISNAVYFLLFE